eukprot:403355716
MTSSYQFQSSQGTPSNRSPMNICSPNHSQSLFPNSNKELIVIEDGKYDDNNSKSLLKINDMNNKTHNRRSSSFNLKSKEQQKQNEKFQDTEQSKSQLGLQDDENRTKLIVQSQNNNNGTNQIHNVNIDNQRKSSVTRVSNNQSHLSNSQQQPHSNSNFPDPQLLMIIQILKKNPEQRTEKDLNTLAPMLKEIRFFKERGEIETHHLIDLCQALRYEFCEAGKFVFKQGDYGDCFYVILRGRVSVLIQNSSKGSSKVGAQVKSNMKIRKSVLINNNTGSLFSNQLVQKQNQNSSDPSTSASGTGNVRQQLIFKNKTRTIMQNQLDQIDQEDEEVRSTYENPQQNSHPRFTAVLNNIQKGQQESSMSLQTNATVQPQALKYQQDDKLLQRIIIDEEDSFRSELSIISQGESESEIEDKSSTIYNQGNATNNYGANPMAGSNNAFKDQINMIQQINQDIKKSSKKKQEKVESNLSNGIEIGAYDLQNINNINEQQLELEQKEFSSKNIEISQLGNGQSFGELALIEQKPRMASIRCIQNTHFAVISKQDYIKVLGIIERKKYNERIQFLRQLPYFSQLTKTSLGKLTYQFIDLKTIKNQVLYREGEPAEYVYIVKDGQFEVTRMEKDRPIGQDNKAIGGMSTKEILENPLRSMKVSNTKSLINTGKNNKTHKVYLFKLEKGNLIGDEDMVNHDEIYSTTVICCSLNGLVGAMKREDFMRIENQQSAWKALQLNCRQKNQQINKNIALQNEVLQQINSPIKSPQPQNKQTEKSKLKEQINQNQMNQISLIDNLIHLNKERFQKNLLMDSQINNLSNDSFRQNQPPHFQNDSLTTRVLRQNWYRKESELRASNDKNERLNSSLTTHQNFQRDQVRSSQDTVRKNKVLFVNKQDSPSQNDKASPIGFNHQRSAEQNLNYSTYQTSQEQQRFALRQTMTHFPQQNQTFYGARTSSLSPRLNSNMNINYRRMNMPNQTLLKQMLTKKQQNILRPQAVTIKPHKSKQQMLNQSLIGIEGFKSHPVSGNISPQQKQFMQNAQLNSQRAKQMYQSSIQLQHSLLRKQITQNKFINE